MGVEIKEVKDRGDLKRFVKFPFELYRNNPYWVPPMIKDELDTFSSKENPAFEHCEAKLWLALDNGEIVGRICGILHRTEIEKKKLGRFGWIDFIDDQEVSKKLINTVESWCKEKGLKGLHGPLGFTDLDFEGMLVEGFDEIGTIATIYNHSYYPRHLEALGFLKAADWVEMEATVPQEVPYRIKRKAEIIEGRFKFRSLSFKSAKDMLPYGKAIFDIINDSYKDLYGYWPLTNKQIDKYISQYLSFINPKFSSVVVNKDDEVVGFGITMPSLSRAYQKAKGRLFPFGFIHLLRALKRNSTADFYIVGILPDYQKMGIPLLFFRDIWPQLIKRGIRKVYSNPALEDNHGVLNHWMEYQDNHRVRKRRRCYVRKIA